MNCGISRIFFPNMHDIIQDDRPIRYFCFPRKKKNMQKGSLLRDHRLYMIFAITLMAVMGVASLTPAFPGVIDHFRINPRQVGWLIAAFTLPGIVMTPLTGILADRFGRKTVLVPSMFLFACSGFLCFFSPDFNTLVILRFFQGIGAASFGTLNVTLVGDFFDSGRRQSAMGYNASILSLGTAFYPAIGGVLANIGWQFPFLLPLTAIPVAVWLWTSLPAHEQMNQRLNSYFRNIWIKIRQPQIWILFLLTFFIFMVLYGSILTYLPILMKQRMNSEPGEIGMIMSLMSLVTAAIASQSGKTARLLRPVYQILLGLIFYFIAILAYWKSESTFLLVLPSVLFGIGHGMILPCIQNKLVSYASFGERAAFMSANSLLNRTGQTLGPLFAGLSYTVAGLTGVFLSGAVLILVMIVITLALLKIGNRKDASLPGES
jgi:predicted MFS family arabinose efflux permease